MSNFDDNPLFQNIPGNKPTPDEPDEPAEVKEIKQALSGHSHHKVIQPLPGQSGRDDSSAHQIVNEKKDTPEDHSSAIDMLRYKIDALYGSEESKEPGAKDEIEEVKHIPDKNLSKHQKYMQELSESGKSLSEIQTEWHNYYINLSDKEKHEVWQEFYAEHSKEDAKIRRPSIEPPKQSAPHHEVKHQEQDLRSVAEVKEQLMKKVQTRSKAKKKSTHLQSLFFGLGMGTLVVLVMLFGFFNERIIAPFITPSRTVSSTPIISDPATTKVGPEPMIIIPKINVEIPVVYTEPSIEEAAIQNALEKGVVHYATTTKPGEIGNGVIFGHSSNNILNKGNYKFAFVLLSRMEKDDIFMLHKDGTRYVYKVFEKKIVPPTDISVLGKSAKPSTFTLITCDPPGTSLNRLVVTGEQVSPDPKINVASTATQNSSRNKVETLPSNAPSLWSRITTWLRG